MMTDRMRDIVRTIEQLPTAAQDALAEQTASALDEARGRRSCTIPSAWSACVHWPTRRCAKRDTAHEHRDANT